MSMAAFIPGRPPDYGPGTDGAQKYSAYSVCVEGGINHNDDDDDDQPPWYGRSVSTVSRFAMVNPMTQKFGS